jgi:uncharacterized cupin superfamily protein
MATPAAVELSPSSIPAEWIIEGTPKAWSKRISRTRDEISEVVVWECTAGHFTWHYKKDESVTVISGEAFLIKPNGEEIRFGAGDVGFFPAGTVCTWRVPGLFRKVAVMREPMWHPVGYAAKACNRLLQWLGLAAIPSLESLDHAGLSATRRMELEPEYTPATPRR